MRQLELKPTHKVVQEYYESLAKFAKLGIKHETAVRSAFYVLLEHCGRQVGWKFVPEYAIKRKGKADGQPAHTREVKLGCVFTQTAWDQEGYAIRDPDSTTYTGAIETAEEFGKRIYLVV